MIGEPVGRRRLKGQLLVEKILESVALSVERNVDHGASVTVAALTSTSNVNRTLQRSTGRTGSGRQMT
jgi:hypothetical protein